VAKPRSVYRCTECGHEHPKWAGRCEGCGAWNAVSEEPVVVSLGAKGGKGAKGGSSFVVPQRLRDVSATPLERWRTGLKELDFVVGGGFVPGSLTLIGGEPGIGKSTLLLQAAGKLEQSGRIVLYSSGEESTEQLQMRAERLGGGAGAVHAIGETRLEAILEAAASISADVLVLDSIQTVATDSLESAPGNVGQVREFANPLPGHSLVQFDADPAQTQK